MKNISTGFGLRVAAVAAFASPCSAQCAGDLNGDRSVDGADLGVLLFAWGPAVPQSPADLDGDGQVGGADLGLLLFGWGACPVFTPPWATLVEAQPDPAVVTDPALRAAIAATGLAWRVRDTHTQIEMLLVPPGTFQMGCIMGSVRTPECPTWERPVHQVTLTNAFYLGRYEVTQAQWQARMGSNPSFFKNASTQVPAAQVPNRPVEQVTWTAIQGYLGATGMRLPTEAEWEYACRAGTQTPFYNGSTDDNTVGDLAWYGECCPINGNIYPGNSNRQTHPVGGKAANAFGFHDMHGNVGEWVNDWYVIGYSANAQTDPTGPASGSPYPWRVLRGGGWDSGTYGVFSSARGGGSPSDTNNIIGFRVARTP
jgi:formylglycine-generating enzyme required for sulfatase activity